MKSLSLILAVMLLAACSATVVSSYRSPGAEIKPVGIHVIFEDSSLQSSGQSSGRGISHDTEANQQRLMLGNSVIERLTERLSENGLPSSSKALSTEAMPASRDYSSLFPDDQKSWHSLVVTPTQVLVACSLSCGYTFRVSMRLVEPRSNKIVWSATLDQPTVRLAGGAGRQGAYNNFADEMAHALLRDIQPSKQQ